MAKQKKKISDYNEGIFLKDVIEAELKKMEAGDSRLVIFRKTGRLTLSWGSFFEMMTKTPGPEESTVLKVIAKTWELNAEEVSEDLEAVTKVLIETCVKLCKKRGRSSVTFAENILWNIYNIFPFLDTYVNKQLKKPQVISTLFKEIFAYVPTLKDFLPDKEFTEYKNRLSLLWNLTSGSEDGEIMFATGLIENFDFATKMWEGRSNEKSEAIYNHYLSALFKRGINLIEIYMSNMSFLDGEEDFIYKLYELQNEWAVITMDELDAYLDNSRVSLFFDDSGKFRRIEWLKGLVDIAVWIANNFRVLPGSCSEITTHFFLICAATEEELIKLHKQKFFSPRLYTSIIKQLIKADMEIKVPLLIQWLHEEDQLDE